MAFRFNGIECDTLEELEQLRRLYGAASTPLVSDRIKIGWPYDLGGLQPSPTDQRCAHMSCSQCGGSGVRRDGLGACVHMLVCSCPRCSVYCLSVSTTGTYTV